MKKTITSSLIIIIAFLLYRYSKFFWAYIVFGKEQWLAMDMVYSSSLMLLTGLVIAFGCSKLLYGNFLPQNFGLKEDFLKSLATAFILSLPMFLGYACCFGWNEESDLKLVYRDLVLAGFGEEFIYRGFLFGFLFYYAKWGFIPANLLPSLFFGLGHLYQANDPMGSLFVFLFTALGSAGFAWFYYAWNSLWTIIFLHGFMDLAWDLFNVDTNVVGNTTVNIFRFTTLILTIIWSIKVSEKEGRGGAELLKKMWVNKRI